MNTGRQFGPMKADNPAIGERCQCCLKSFKEGDYTTLVPIGPGDDPETQRKYRDGEACNEIAVHVHYSCATGRPPYK
jgi:hypothetical protein